MKLGLSEIFLSLTDAIQDNTSWAESVFTGHHL